MTVKRVSRTRKTLPRDIRALFMLGAGANTSYTQQEIRELWKEHGAQFLRHMDSLDRSCSQFRQYPMIFDILGLDEATERAKFGL
jgi:hypothetical protein